MASSVAGKNVIDFEKFPAVAENANNIQILYISVCVCVCVVNNIRH